MTPLPLTDQRQVISTEANGKRTFKLVKGQKFIGTYHGDERVLRKKIDPGKHTYRAKPGVGLNLEMLAELDRIKPAPDRLEIVTPHMTYKLAWAVVKMYAIAAALHANPAYLITDDVDKQVLIPWEALLGEKEGPDPYQTTLLSP